MGVRRPKRQNAIIQEKNRKEQIGQSQSGDLETNGTLLIANGLCRKRESLTEEQVETIEKNRNAAIQRRNAKRHKSNPQSREEKGEDTNCAKGAAQNIEGGNVQEKGRNEKRGDPRLKGSAKMISCKVAGKNVKTEEGSRLRNESKPHKGTKIPMAHSSRTALVKQCLSEATSATRPYHVQMGQQVGNVNKRKPDTVYSFGALVKRTCLDRLT